MTGRDKEEEKLRKEEKNGERSTRHIGILQHMMEKIPVQYTVNIVNCNSVEVREKDASDMATERRADRQPDRGVYHSCQAVKLSPRLPELMHKTQSLHCSSKYTQAGRACI
jgi:hypothetical protein